MKRPSEPSEAGDSNPQAANDGSEEAWDLSNLTDGMNYDHDTCIPVDFDHRIEEFSSTNLAFPPSLADHIHLDVQNVHV